MSINDYNLAKEKASFYCAQQDHCIFDIKKKLSQWGVDVTFYDDIIEYLIKENFINETRYSENFCLSKLHQNKWGRKKISYALSQKGIHNNDIQQGLAAIQEDEYNSILHKLIIQKAKTIKGNSLFEKKQKLIKSITTKGFEPTLIIKMIKEESIF